MIDVEVVRLVELEPVADAHDLFDFGQRLTARRAFARHDADDLRRCCRAEAACRDVGVEHDLVRGYGMTTKLSWPRSKPPTEAAFHDADDRVSIAPRRTLLPIGSMPDDPNSAWYGLSPARRPGAGA